MRVRELQAARGEAVDPLELPAPLNELPWEVAQKQFGVKGADFIGQMGRVLLKRAKKQMLTQVTEPQGEFGEVHTGFG